VPQDREYDGYKLFVGFQYRMKQRYEADIAVLQSCPEISKTVGMRSSSLSEYFISACFVLLLLTMNFIQGGFARAYLPINPIGS